MTAIEIRSDRSKVRSPRRFRLDAANTEVTPDSIILKRWTAHHATLYSNLLQTIAAAPKAAR